MKQNSINYPSRKSPHITTITNASNSFIIQEEDIVEVNSDDSDAIVSPSHNNNKRRLLCKDYPKPIYIDETEKPFSKKVIHMIDFTKTSVKRERSEDVIFLSSKKVNVHEKQQQFEASIHSSSSVVNNVSIGGKDNMNVTNNSNITNSKKNTMLIPSLKYVDSFTVLNKPKIEEESIIVKPVVGNTLKESSKNNREMTNERNRNRNTTQQHTTNGGNTKDATPTNQNSVNNSTATTLSSNPIVSSTNTPPLPPPINQNKPVNNLNVEQLTQQTLVLIENLKKRSEFSSVTCPLTCKIIRHPVLASDGIIYDKPFILSYMSEHGSYSPLVKGCKISESSLIIIETVKTKAVSLVESKIGKIIELIQNNDFSKLSPLIPESYLGLIQFGMELIDEGELKTPSTQKFVEILRKEKSKLLTLLRDKLKQQGSINQIYNTLLDSYELFKLGFNCGDIEQVLAYLLIADKERDGITILDQEKRVELIQDLFILSNSSIPKLLSNFNIEKEFGVIFELLVLLMQRNICKFESISTVLIQKITESNKGDLDNPFFKQMLFFRDQLVMCKRELE